MVTVLARLHGVCDRRLTFFTRWHFMGSVMYVTSVGVSQHPLPLYPLSCPLEIQTSGVDVVNIAGAQRPVMGIGSNPAGSL